jgi:lipopolysaccharide export system permease protein
VQMTPPAVLVATVITLSSLSRTNELVACYSIGVGLRQIMAIILSIVFMVCCLSLVMQDRVLPPFFRKQTTYFWRDMKKRSDFYLDLKQDKIWYRSKNLIYNLRTFDPKTNTISGMAVYTMDEQFHLVEVVEAKRAQFNQKGWKLQDGTVTVFSGADDFPMTTHFDEKDLSIGETPKDFQQIEKEVNGLRLKELRKYIERVKQTGADTKAYLVQFHAKISLSFIPLVMCILAVPFSTRTRREGGMGRDLALCLGVIFIYWLFYSTGLSLGSKGTVSPVLAAWFPSLFFAGVAGGWIYWKWRR